MHGQRARTKRFKTGTSQLRETTLTENIGPPGQPRVGARLTIPPWKRLVTKSEEAIAGYFSWQKFLRKGPRMAVEPIMMKIAYQIYSPIRNKML
jgi:hypothetical protein